MSKLYAIALGTFDGLHLGHKAVLEKICFPNLTPIALTFDIPPKQTENGECGLLLTKEDKHHLLDDAGVMMVSLDFEAIRSLSPTQFLNEIKEKYNPCLIACGFNFRFGKNAVGDVHLLQNFCSENNIDCKVAQPVFLGEQPISSTRIRNAISFGELEIATQMLGRYFSFEAPVIHGDARGRTIGFPTLNQVYSKELILPRFGVYASLTEIDGVHYQSVTNIGKRPTFETDYVISETYLFDYSGDAYKKNARVSLVGFIRDEMRFDGIESLQKALREDEAKALIQLKGL